MTVALPRTTAITMKEHSHIEALSHRVYPRRQAVPLLGAELEADVAPTPLVDNRYVIGKRVAGDASVKSTKPRIKRAATSA